MTSTLHSQMQKLEQLFDLDAIISQNFSLAETEIYYEHSSLGYFLFHSMSGALHMAISDTDNFDPSDYLAQVTHIAKDIEALNASIVLELGMGKGFNIYHLKHKLPNLKLYGVDYSKLHLKQARAKVEGKAVRSDFHYLPFAINTFDYIFEIESICHATDMKQALTSVYRSLKPNGVFSIFDGFRIIPSNTLTTTEMKARHLVEKPLGVNEGILIDDFLDIATTVGFEIISQNNISERIMPNLIRLRNLQNRFLPNKLFFQLAKLTLPKYLVRNAIAAMLMPTMVKEGYQGYFQITLKK